MLGWARLDSAWQGSARSGCGWALLGSVYLGQAGGSAWAAQGRPVGGSGGSAEPPVLGWVPSRTGWVGEGWKEKKRGRKKEKEAKK